MNARVDQPTCSRCGAPVRASAYACALCGASTPAGERVSRAFDAGRAPIEALSEPHAVDCAVEFDDPSACTCGRNAELRARAS